MSLIGQDVKLRGALGWKGERGYSAYEIAVQNGYIGSEKDWLAQLGTSAYFMKDSKVYTATASQTSFALPSSYTSNSCVDVYVEGFRLPSNKYSVNTSNLTVNLVDALDAGAIVEVVVLRMTTSDQITTTIDANSTNEKSARS
jgi:hypothetical protein